MNHHQAAHPCLPSDTIESSTDSSLQILTFCQLWCYCSSSSPKVLNIQMQIFFFMASPPVHRAKHLRSVVYNLYAFSFICTERHNGYNCLSLWCVMKKTSNIITPVTFIAFSASEHDIWCGNLDLILKWNFELWLCRQQVYDEDLWGWRGWCVSS